MESCPSAGKLSRFKTGRIMQKVGSVEGPVRIGDSAEMRKSRRSAVRKLNTPILSRGSYWKQHSEPAQLCKMYQDNYIGR